MKNVQIQQLSRKVKPRHLLLVALAVAGFLVFRRATAGQAPALDEGSFVPATGGDFSGVAGPAGGSVGGDTGTDFGAASSDLATLIAAIQAQQEDLAGRVSDYAGHVTELEDAFSAGGYTLNEDKTWSAPGVEADAFPAEANVFPLRGDVPPEVYDRELPPVAGPNAEPPPGGIRYGGQVFKTKTALGRALAAKGAFGKGNADAAYREWAKRHPDAASTLAGPVPKPPARGAQKPPRRPPRDRIGDAGDAAKAKAKAKAKKKKKKKRKGAGGGGEARLSRVGAAPNSLSRFTSIIRPPPSPTRPTLASLGRATAYRSSFLTALAQPRQAATVPLPQTRTQAAAVPLPQTRTQAATVSRPPVRTTAVRVSGIRP